MAEIGVGMIFPILLSSSIYSDLLVFLQKALLLFFLVWSKMKCRMVHCTNGTNGQNSFIQVMAQNAVNQLNCRIHLSAISFKLEKGSFWFSLVDTHPRKLETENLVLVSYGQVCLILSPSVSKYFESNLPTGW